MKKRFTEEQFVKALTRIKKHTNIFVFLGLFILGFTVFSHCLSSDFLSYDDRGNIIENPYLIRKDYLYFWGNSYFGLFIPVVLSVWTFIYSVFSLNSVVFHGINILVHVLNAYLLFHICKHFKISTKAAIFAAVFFLTHPLQVESVAWVTGLKDILSSFFSLLSIIVFFKYSQRSSGKIALLFLLLLAIFSKPSTGVLPFLFLTVAFFQWHRGENRLGMGEILSKNFHLLIAGIFGFASLVASSIIQQNTLSSYKASIFDHVLIVFDSLGFYVKKIFIPLDLYPDYGRTPKLIIENNLYYANVVTSVLFCLAIFAILKRIKKRHFEYFFTVSFMLGLAILFFLPTSGIVDFAYQSISSTADRYCYLILASVGLFLGLAYDFLVNKNSKVVQFAFVSFLGLFALCSFFQTFVWTNNQVFFEYMLEGNPQSYNAVNNLGVIHQMQGEFDKALEKFERAKELRPLEITPIAGLIVVYYKQHNYIKLDELAQEYLARENMQKMVLSARSTSIALKLYAYSLLERNRKEDAFPFFCRAGTYSQITMNEIYTLVMNLQSELNRKCVDILPDQK